MRVKLATGMTFSVLVWAAALQAAVYQAPSAEPTPEETQILEYMNRFRANPSAEADKILAFIKSGKAGWVARGVDLAMFENEMKALKPSPPLVLNLKLLDAARKHSYYMIHNGLTHVETAGKEGFVAADFGSRCKNAGYEGGPGGENCYASAPDAWGSHVGFVVDSGPGGTGGMQPGRGHRTNMHNPGMREVGPGAVPRSGDRGGLSVTHNMGSRKVRFVGGVVFTDRNSNEWYDLDEGVGGVSIKCSDGSEVRTWKSGAYTLALKGNAAVTVTASLGARTFSQEIPAGAENVKFDWRVPEEAALELADKLLAKVESVPGKSGPGYTNAILELYQATQGLAVDAPRRQKIDELTKEIGPQLEGSKKAVLEALRNFGPEFPKVLNESQQPFQGTAVAAWFKEAAAIGQAKGSFIGFKQQVETNKTLPEQQKRQFLTYLQGLEKQFQESEFKSELAALIDQTIPLADPKRAGMYKR